MDNLRPLLPAPGGPSGSQEDPTMRLKRKRSHITKVACNACRGRRTACDGTRPICTACQKRRTTCEYVSVHEQETRTMALKREKSALKEKAQILDEVMTALRTLPEEVALEVFNKIRTSSNTEAAIEAVRGYTIPVEPSQLATARNFLPEVQSEQEMELIIRHSNAYPPLVDLNEAFLGEVPLFQHRVAYETLKIPKRYEIESSTAMGNASQQLPRASAPASTRTSTSSTTNPSPSNRGLSTPESASSGDEALVSNHVLQQLKLLKNIGYWTKAPNVSNQTAANIIALYLETDHPTYGFFDARLFINSLVEGRLDYCSPFLVCSLLAFASQAYTAFDPRAGELSRQFQLEAERLWLTVGRIDSILTLTGLMFLCLSCGGHGEGVEHSKYIDEAAKMAMHMKLFGVADRLQPEDIVQFTDEHKRALVNITWGTFNTLTMQAVFYVGRAFEFPPALPIPSDTTSDQAPSSLFEVSLGQYMHPSFTIFCSFWVIVAQTLFVYRQSDENCTPSVAFARSKHEELLALMDNLPEGVVRSDSSPGHVMVFHIWYHSFVLDIFRPFINDSQQHELRVWSSNATDVQSVFSASIKQLKRLIVLYCGLQPNANYCILWHAALIYVANAVLRDTKDSEWHFYFLLCIRGYQRLSVCFEVFRGIVQGLLAMAVEKGVISSAEAQDILKQEGPEKVNGGVAMLPFMVDLDLAITDRENAKVDTLAAKLTDLVLFSEFTEGLNDSE